MKDRPVPLQVERADSTADWLATKALVDGLDPYASLYDLADHYQTGYENPAPRGRYEIAHPRPPGALLLLTPLALLDARGALTLMLVASIVAVSFAALLLNRWFHLSVISTVAFATYGVMLGPAIWSFRFGSQSHLLLLGMTVFVVAIWSNHEVTAGAALGLVATLKLFPLIVVIVLIHRRLYRSVAACVLVFLGLNSLPLLKASVTWSGVWKAIGHAGEIWSRLGSNVSLGPVLRGYLGGSSTTVTLVQIGLVGWLFATLLRRRMSMIVALELSIVVGLIVSPLSWPHYVLIASPLVVVGYALSPPIGWARWSVPIGVGLTAVANVIPLITVGLLFLAVSYGYGRFRTDGQSMGHSMTPALRLDHVPGLFEA